MTKIRYLYYQHVKIITKILKMFLENMKDADIGTIIRFVSKPQHD